MRKIISFLFILTGLSLMLYPKILESYHDHQQQKILKEWQEAMLSIDQEIIEPIESEFASDILMKKELIKEELEKKQREEKEKEAEQRQREVYIKNNMEGILKIKKINLELPILSGDTAANLNISAASIRHTGKPGQTGNYSIAGHRSHTYGRNFNRLNELEVGDLIQVNDGINEYNYEVVDIFTVNPDEVWVLNGNGTDKEITLITCTPLYESTHRLIVKGKIFE